MPPEPSVRCDRRSHHRLPTTRLCGVWCTQATHSRCTDPGATGHPSLSTTLQAALSAIPANRYRSALDMLRLRRLLRPRQNDRVSRRIKSQRSSDKPAWDNALLHRAREPKFCRRVAVRTSIARTESFANLQTCYERLWQSPSSNDKCNQRNNQNNVDDRRFQQFLFRV